MAKRSKEEYLDIMGLLSDIFGFLEDLANGSSYYKEDSIAWCDKVWRRMRYAERGEARLYQVGDKVYRQLYVVLDDGIEGYLTDTNDRGCNVESLIIKRERQKELERIGHIIIKKYQ